jgi:hypothetical protein
MRYLLIVVLALSAGLLLACQDAAPALSQSGPPKTPPVKKDEPAHADDAPRISLADAKKDFDAGVAVFIDTRAEDQYKQEHVKGALNITLQDDASKYNSIPKGKKIIVYCS